MSIQITTRLTPDIQHKSRSLLQQFDLGGALDCSCSAFSFTENPGQYFFNLFAHALGLSTDVDVALAIKNGISDVLPVFPNEILYIDFAAVWLVVLTRESTVDFEFSFEFLFVFRPFFTVQEILVFPSATVEQRDTTPISESIRTILFNGTTGQSNTFLDETTERSDTLMKCQFTSK